MSRIKLLVILAVIAGLGIWWKWSVIQPMVQSKITPATSFLQKYSPTNWSQPKISTQEISANVSQFQSQTVNTGQKLLEAGNNLGELTSTMIKIKELDDNSSATGVQERIFESARYLYCKAVVKDYEAKLATASAQTQN